MNFRRSLGQFNTILAPEYRKLSFWVKLVGRVILHPLGLLPVQTQPSEVGSWEIGFKSRVRAKPAAPKVDTSNLLWHC